MLCISAELASVALMEVFFMVTLLHYSGVVVFWTFHGLPVTQTPWTKEEEDMNDMEPNRTKV